MNFSVAEASAPMILGMNFTLAGAKSDPEILTMSSSPAGVNVQISGMNFSPAGAKDPLTPRELGTLLGKNFSPVEAKEVSLKMTWTLS